MANKKEENVWLKGFYTYICVKTNIMENWKGTKGSAELNERYEGMILTNNGSYSPNAMMWTIASKEELEANANLIVDAFNTINKCDLLPSELLEQRDELLEALQMVTAQFQDLLNSLHGQNINVIGWHQNGEPQSFDSFIDGNDDGGLEKAEQAIKKALK